MTAIALVGVVVVVLVVGFAFSKGSDRMQTEINRQRNREDASDQDRRG